MLLCESSSSMVLAQNIEMMPVPRNLCPGFPDYIQCCVDVPTDPLMGPTAQVSPGFYDPPRSTFPDQTVGGFGGIGVEGIQGVQQLGTIN